MSIGLKMSHEKIVMELLRNTLYIFKEMKSILKVNTIWLVGVVSMYLSVLKLLPLEYNISESECKCEYAHRYVVFPWN